MPFDKITHFIFGLSFICILLTIVAISAQAEENNLSQPVSHIAKSINPAQNLITRQLDAIMERDADLAYSMTTNNFHEKFGTAKDFLSHIRFQLRPVYNHVNYTFIGQHNSQKGLVQKLEMDDRYGDPVTVIYRLEQQDSGQWLIDSFTILDLDAEAI